MKIEDLLLVLAKSLEEVAAKMRRVNAEESYLAVMGVASTMYSVAGELQAARRANGG